MSIDFQIKIAATADEAVAQMLKGNVALIPKPPEKAGRTDLVGPSVLIAVFPSADDLADLLPVELRTQSTVFLSCLGGEYNECTDTAIQLTATLLSVGEDDLALVYSGDVPLLYRFRGATVVLTNKGESGIWRIRNRVQLIREATRCRIE